MSDSTPKIGEILDNAFSDEEEKQFKEMAEAALAFAKS